MIEPRRSPSRAIAIAPFAILCVTACAAGHSVETPARSPEAPAAAPATLSAPVKAAPEEEPTSDRAPSAPSAGGALPASTERELEPNDIDALARQLDGSLQLSTPDCTTAWALRDKICDLSQRLCDLAARSAEPDVAERCTDGRTRCERATTRVRATCSQ